MVAPDDRLERLIDHLYDAAVGVCGWDAALRDMADAFAARCAAFGILGPQAPGRILHTGLDPALVERYLLHHAGRSELARRTEGLPPGSVVTDTSVMSKAEFRCTAFYRDCLQPLDLDSLMICRAARQPDGLVANVCLFRTRQQGDFTPGDVARYERLAPHLFRVVALHLRIAEAEGDRRALDGALEMLPRAALLVDGAAQVLRTNAAGAALLAVRDGLRAGSGALRARLPEETATLRRMVAEAVGRPARAGGGAPHLVLSRAPPLPPLILAILPLGTAGASSLGLPPAAAALLLVTDPTQRPEPPPPALLREAFGLTRAEAEVAARAAQGEEVARIAEALGTTQGTTRLHLHRAFEKIGVHRQAELALVLGRLHR